MTLVPGDPGDRLLASSVVPGRAWEPQMKKLVIDRLLAVWEQHPGLRLGQLLGNVYYSVDQGGVRQYYAEDFDLVRDLERFYDGRDTSF